MKRNVAQVVGAVVLTVGVSIVAPSSFTSLLPGQEGLAAASSSDPTHVCGEATLLDGPATAPTGAVTIAAGTDHVTLAEDWNLAADTTYYLASGVHTLGTGEYTQIDPADGDTFIGAPGAVLTGQGDNAVAFGGHASDVTIEYLTISRFKSTSTQYDVNHTGAVGWKMEQDTVETTTTGAALDMGPDNVVQYDCLTKNAQYGFSGYDTTGNVATVTFSHNEVSDNDGSTLGGGKYTQPGSPYQCGCSGGGKFWDAKNVVVETNWIHNNGNVGIWVDTDNRGFLISHNYISTNYAEGLIYEISYNAEITDNTFVHNAVTAGPTLKGFPDPALYVSESGGDARVQSDYAGTFSVSGNVFSDNWGGVVLWENSNRYCGDGSDSLCTLVTPATYTTTSCKAHLSGSKPTQSPDYFDNCRWKTQNVTVTDNTFTLTRAQVASDCTAATLCGFNGLFSEYGTTTPWKAWIVPEDISNTQDDHFSDNTYDGPWEFDSFALGNVVTWTKWTAGVTDVVTSGDQVGGQDAGSTYNGTAASLLTQPSATSPRPPTTTTTTPQTTTTTTTPQTTTTTTTTASPPSSRFATCLRDPSDCRPGFFHRFWGYGFH